MWPFFLLLIVGGIGSPYAYECGLSVAAQWRTLMGTYTVVETPRLDQLREFSQTASAALRAQTRPFLGGSRWQAQTAVPLALGWAAAMGFVFLHKSR